MIAVLLQREKLGFAVASGADRKAGTDIVSCVSSVMQGP